ncbi:hypothetical protein SAMN05428975_1986 [Mucilaginibacter sp. OK268]|nr:hypothetical protein SAMN05428975_1986 [Mucilaginibacter sp. OK268]
MLKNKQDSNKALLIFLIIFLSEQIANPQLILPPESRISALDLKPKPHPACF